MASQPTSPALSTGYQFLNTGSLDAGIVAHFLQAKVGVSISLAHAVFLKALLASVVTVQKLSWWQFSWLPLTWYETKWHYPPHLHISGLISEQMLTCEKRVQIKTLAYFCSYWMAHPDVPVRNPSLQWLLPFLTQHMQLQTSDNHVSGLASCPLLHLPYLGWTPEHIRSWWEDDPQFTVPTSLPCIHPPHYTIKVTTCWTQSSTGVNHWAVKPDTISDYLQGHPLGSVRLFKDLLPVLFPESPVLVPNTMLTHAPHCGLPSSFSLSTYQMLFLVRGSFPMSPATGEADQPSGKKKLIPSSMSFHCPCSTPGLYQTIILFPN